MTGTIYLIPSSLGENNNNFLFPPENTNIINSLKYFIVENIRTARRFIRSVSAEAEIDSIQFFTLNKHTDSNEICKYINPAFEGHDIGIISEAGCPGIADPGADIVAIAHKKNIRVIPLIGPSSIFLALMASGFNGQNFAFTGYLPIKTDRIKAVKHLENLVFSKNQTQIFMETPYRNQKLFEELLKNCSLESKLCIACNIATLGEFIRTMSIKEWKRNVPDLNKKPTIFILGKTV